MSDPRLECPSCNAPVWHDCMPASYWKDRRLRRAYRLRQLRPRPIDERIEDERTQWTRRLFEGFDSAVGANSILEATEEEEEE